MKKMMLVILAFVTLLMGACTYNEAFLEDWAGYMGNDTQSTSEVLNEASTAVPSSVPNPVTSDITEMMTLRDEELDALFLSWPLADHPMNSFGTLDSFWLSGDTDGWTTLIARFYSDETQDALLTPFNGYGDIDIEGSAAILSWDTPDDISAYMCIDDLGKMREVYFSFDGYTNTTRLQSALDAHWPDGLVVLPEAMCDLPPVSYEINILDKTGVEYSKTWEMQSDDEAYAQVQVLAAFLSVYESEFFIEDEGSVHCVLGDVWIAAWQFENEVVITLGLNDKDILADWPCDA